MRPWRLPVSLGEANTVEVMFLLISKGVRVSSSTEAKGSILRKLFLRARASGMSPRRPGPIGDLSATVDTTDLRHHCNY